MVVKITNSARPAVWENEWKTSSSGTVVGSGAKLIGVIKDFDGVTDGMFIPGRLRLNPVTIRTGTGSVIAASYAAQQTNYSANKQWWRGEFACDNYTSAFYGTYDGTLANYSLVKAAAKLNQADTDVALMIAELMETLEMLRNPFKGLRSMFDKIRAKQKSEPGKGRPGKDLSRLVGIDASNQWLEYRYGILPLLSDISAIIKEFQTKVEQLSNSLRSKRGFTRDTRSSSPSKIATGFSGSTWTRVASTQLTYECTSIVYYHWFLGLTSTAFRYGFDPSQMPALIWEKVPFSFVVDWLFRVGDWLRAISPAPYMTVNGNCTSQKIVGVLKVDQIDFSPGPYWTLLESNPSNFAWQSETLIRAVNSSLPVAPVFNHKWFAFQRLLDILALLLGGTLKGLRK